MPSQILLSVSSACRLRKFSYRTEKTYIYWIRGYIYFVKKAHPATCGDQDVQAFLAYLAENQHVSANTQKVALNALVFTALLKHRATTAEATVAEQRKILVAKDEKRSQIEADSQASSESVATLTPSLDDTKRRLANQTRQHDALQQELEQLGQNRLDAANQQQEDITVLEIEGQRVSLGISAAKDVLALRGELHESLALA